MQKVMKPFSLDILLLVGYIEFSTKMVMESINVKIDDAITKVEMVDDEEGPSIKEPTVEVEALDIEVEGPTPEKE